MTPTPEQVEQFIAAAQAHMGEDFGTGWATDIQAHLRQWYKPTLQFMAKGTFQPMEEGRPIIQIFGGGGGFSKTSHPTVYSIGGKEEKL